MRLMYPFIMTPLTFMYLTRKGTSDIMRSEHTRQCYLLFFDLTHLNAEGGGGWGGGGGNSTYRLQGPVLSISANPGLNFNAGFFFSGYFRHSF